MYIKMKCFMFIIVELLDVSHNFLKSFKELIIILICKI